MFESQIIDLFYKEIVPEAQKGRVDCFFMMNLIFNLSINNQEITRINDQEYQGVLIPTLSINNKELFDELLIEYVVQAKEKYNAKNFDFLEDVEYLGPGTKEDIDNLKTKYLIKYIICSLFANASFIDFSDPVRFLQSRIRMLNNKILNDDYVDLGYLESIGARLCIIEEESPIKAETPYRLRGYLEYDDGYQLYLPEVYAGNSEDKYLIYGIQKTTKNSEIDEKKYIKQIRQGMISKINGAPEHYFLMLMIFIALAQDKPIEAVPFLVERWNAKNQALARKKDMTDEEKEEYQINLQNNITNVFIRNFTKIKDVCTGMEFTAVPFYIDDRLHISIEDGFTTRVPVFEEVFNKITAYKQNSKKL